MNKTKIYDFIVVGSSIAACSFALNISKDKEVLLIDKRDIFSSDFKNYKPCGGLIAPDAQAELFQQRILIKNEILVDPQLISVLNYDFDNNCDKFFSRFYYNIDRQKFDKMLLEKALLNKNIHYLNDLVVSYDKEKDFYKVTTKNTVFYSKKIVLAQGWNNSLVPKELKPKNDNKYIIIQEWFKLTEAETPAYGVVFDQSITDYYGWFIPKGEYIEVGVAIDKKEKRDYQTVFKQLKNNLEEKGINLSQSVYKEGCQVIRPRSSKEVNMGNEEVIIIGEAANLISPSSAEGFSYALISGRLVAEGINNENLDLKKIENKFKRNIQYKLFKSKIMYNKYARKLIYLTKLHQLINK